MVLTDDRGCGELGFHGNAALRTPAIDADTRRMPHPVKRRRSSVMRGNRRPFDEVSAVHIGSTECPRVDLTTQELRNESGAVVFRQGRVRAGKGCLGGREVFAERSGPGLVPGCTALGVHGVALKMDGRHGFADIWKRAARFCARGSPAATTCPGIPS